VDRALAVAIQVAGDDAVELVDGRELRVAVGEDAVPGLARALVAAGVDITGLHLVERSLKKCSST
jgi:ABC-2 type transport system ATP-binding protein